MSDDSFLFRDVFDRARIAQIGDLVKAAWNPFDRDAYIRHALDSHDELSFGDRARLIRDALRAQLPENFEEAADILVRALGPEPAGDSIDGYEGFYVMPLTMFVSEYGLEHPDIALPALYEMTKRFTAEGDIRPFLIRYPDQTMKFIRKLTTDTSPFARRLASEGTRPRLPLSSRLPAFQKDPSPVIALLDRLRLDNNLMVRRSVANNLNDIAKDNPDAVVETLSRWWRELGESAEHRNRLDRLTRHALRTLIKRDHPGALELLGYNGEGVQVTEWEANPNTLDLGEAMSFRLVLRSSAEAERKIALNYVISFLKANGSNHDKVFRLPDRRIAPGDTVEIEKTHVFRPFKNQRFYPGQHFLEVRLNGRTLFRVPFTLNVPDEPSINLPLRSSRA